MKRYEQFNEMFKTNDSLRKQTLSIFMERFLEQIYLDENLEYQCKNIDYEGLFTAIEAWLSEEVQEDE